MPFLTQLRDAGFAVWPFDEPRFPLVIEIYPRLMTGVIAKGNAAKRREYITARFPNLAADIVDKAGQSDDAFDALVSALIMAQEIHDLSSFSTQPSASSRLEGEIWIPRSAKAIASSVRSLKNSSRTRVAPIFNALIGQSGNDVQWVRRLLDLPSGAVRKERPWHAQDLTVSESYFDPSEKGLHPPVALLSWLIRNLEVPKQKSLGSDIVGTKRRLLAERDPSTIEEGLSSLRRSASSSKWHVLEGPSYPDVYIVTRDALIVIEGKRTETGPTTSTTWMSGRHQMLRHLDAAWEIRGQRAVYGFFVVEADPKASMELPAVWAEATAATLSSDAIRSSLPHRSDEEKQGIVGSFLGATTWHAIVAAFGLPPHLLEEPTNVDEATTVNY